MSKRIITGSDVAEAYEQCQIKHSTTYCESRCPYRKMGDACCSEFLRNDVSEVLKTLKNVSITTSTENEKTSDKDPLKGFIEVHFECDNTPLMVKANRISDFWNKRIAFENGDIIQCVETYDVLKEKMAKAMEK